jgi:hypothetical protein
LIVQKSLKNNRRCHLVDHPAMLLARAASFIEKLVGLLSGEALVAQVDGEAGELAQLSGESLALCRLAAFGSVQVQRISHHDTGHVKAASQPGNGAQVFAPAAAAFQRQNRLCGQPQFVGHGYADAAVADIEAKEPGWGGRRQTILSGLQLICPVEPAPCASICTG